MAGWNIAAMVPVILSMAFVLTGRSDDTARGTVAIVASESKTQQLQDGSMVSLDAGSTLRVEFTDERRGVHLSHGKALFDVAMDANRPFIVNTSVVEIAAAVKAKFAVDTDTSVEVAVYEGVVDVSVRGAKAGAPVITVKRGEIYRVPIDRFRAAVADVSDRVPAALIEG